MDAAWVSLIVFVLCYVLFVVLPARRSWTACVGALVLVAAGALNWRDALLEKISWNVMGLFFGTLILAELFIQSRAPAVIAEWLVDRTRTTRAAMLVLCALAGAISIFVENVAVVLLVAPVALSLAEKLKVHPAPLMIGIAISSNLQGTATMIGDPPSMILAGYMKMGFWDFFFYRGKPGIFFAIQAGAIVSLCVLAFFFRRHRENLTLLNQEQARSWAPASFLGVLIVGLSFATAIDPDFRWFVGTYTMALAGLALLWYRGVAHWGKVRTLVRGLDWDTTFFLMGVFVVVGALSESGWLDRLSEGLSASVGSHLVLAFISIVLLAVVISGFVDNVPFLLVMIPVAHSVGLKFADRAPGADVLLLFGLLIGACLGGNLTPIGASANVVTLGLLKKQGHSVSFADFMRIGIPFTIAAVLAGGLCIWLAFGS
ncbi:MAG: arsenic transporter [Kiritimatiellae bacterium]|nr:arsenic transporter [Kiritimatiellia bacterium]